MSLINKWQTNWYNSEKSSQGNVPDTTIVQGNSPQLSKETFPEFNYRCALFIEYKVSAPNVTNGPNNNILRDPKHHKISDVLDGTMKSTASPRRIPVVHETLRHGPTIFRTESGGRSLFFFFVFLKAVLELTWNRNSTSTDPHCDGCLVLL